MAVSRSLIAPTSNPLLERSLIEKLAAPLGSRRQPGRTRAVGGAPGLDAEHAEATLPRPAAAGLCGRPRHGRRWRRSRRRGIPDARPGPPSAQRPVAGGGVCAHPADRADRRRLRRGRGHRRARPAADAQDRARHAQRPRQRSDDARPGTRRHARGHGDRRQAARQHADLLGHRRGLAPQRRTGAVAAEPITGARPAGVGPAHGPGHAGAPDGHRTGRAGPAPRR